MQIEFEYLPKPMSMDRSVVDFLLKKRYVLFLYSPGIPSGIQ